MLKCKICGKYFKHLGSHIWHKHKILAKEYKQKFGLNYDHPLITKEIQEKKKKAFWENPKGLENLKKGENINLRKERKGRIINLFLKNNHVQKSRRSSS